MGKDNGIWIILKGFFLAFFILFFFYPLMLVLLKSFSLNGTGISGFLDLLISNKQLIWNSFYQASFSTLFAVLIGVPAAFLIARREFPGKKLVRALSLIPFVFPSILVVISFVIIFGNNGWINNFLKDFLFFETHIQFLYGFSGIILAHVFYNFPLVMRFVSSSWENLDITMKEASKTLGANKFQTFFRVTLPQLLPSIIASASLVFIFTFMSFAIVLSLGGLQFSTLEVEIFRQLFRKIDFGAGALLAMFQFLALSVFALIYYHFSKNQIKEKVNPEKPSKINLKSFTGFIESVSLLLIVLSILLPIFSLIMFSFFDQNGFTLRAFEKIFFPGQVSLFGTTALSAIAYSLGLALFASVIATVLGMVASLKQTKIFFVNIFVGSSIAVSIITLAFGYFLGFGSGELWIIAIGHSVLAFPFAYRVLNNAVSKIDQESIDSAKTLGANDFQIFQKIQFPRIKNALFVSLAFSFAISLGELGLVLVLYDGIYATMPVYIYRLLTTFDLPAATGMGIILVSISFLSFYIIEYFSKDTQVF